MKKIKGITIVLAMLFVCCGCGGGYSYEEPCEYCHKTPTKKYTTSNGTDCYMCETHTKTCAVCNKTFDKELNHSTNLLDIEVFVCDECIEKYY